MPILVVVLLLFAALSFLANRSAFFPMPYPAGEWQRQAQLGVEDVRITTSDGLQIHGWWKPHTSSKLATLFLHGNAGNVTHRALAVEEIHAAGSSILVLDYRGYGKSEGRPTERGLYRDADAAWQWLIDRGYPPSQVVLHGESLGTTVATDLAARVQPAALILEAPFPSARAVAQRVLPVLGPALVWGFDARAKIPRVRAPILLIHGDRDEVIDYSLGRALFDAAPQPKQFWTVPGAGHNNLIDAAGPEYRRTLQSFYSRLGT
jgi:hypothetical protein